MRKSLRRWLLQRRSPKIQPLIQRTSWGDFAYRMRRAIALDIAIDLGEMTRSEARTRQRTRPLPAIDYNASTIAGPVSPSWEFYAGDTMRAERCRVDEYETQEIPLVLR